jgi:hypothetical protein
MSYPATRSRHHISRLLLCLFLLTLAGCTSSLVVRTLYADLGNRSADRFKQYADFNERQDQWIEDRAAQFHRWHRATQLPLYATELKRLGAMLENQQTLDIKAIKDLELTVRSLTDNVRHCHPLNQASDFLIRLSDRQVSQIDRHMRKQHQEFRDRYNKESSEERLQRRVANITKWSGRFGASFNARQKDLLRQTLQQQHSLGRQRMQQRVRWLDRFNANLQQRKSPEFEQNLRTLLDEQWRETERDYPKEWKENERLWTGFLQEFLTLQSAEQRNTMLSRINKFSNIIAAMSSSRATTVALNCAQQLKPAGSCC